jgi:hypothetical protein
MPSYFEFPRKTLRERCTALREKIPSTASSSRHTYDYEYNKLLHLLEAYLYRSAVYWKENNLILDLLEEIAKLKELKKVSDNDLTTILITTYARLTNSMLHKDYMNLANRMQGHPVLWKQVVGSIMISLGIALLIGSFAFAFPPLAAIVAILIPAIAVSLILASTFTACIGIVGGLAMRFKGKREGLSLLMRDIDKELVQYKGVVYEMPAPALTQEESAYETAYRELNSRAYQNVSTRESHFDWAYKKRMGERIDSLLSEVTTQRKEGTSIERLTQVLTATNTRVVSGTRAPYKAIIETQPSVSAWYGLFKSPVTLAMEKVDNNEADEIALCISNFRSSGLHSW